MRFVDQPSEAKLMGNASNLLDFAFVLVGRTQHPRKSANFEKD